MKKTYVVTGFLLAFCLLSAGRVRAQQPVRSENETKTKFEAFQAQSGSVVIKAYSVIGKISAYGKVEVNAMEFTDASTNEKQTGVAIDVIEGGANGDSNRSFIDYDEIDDLLKGIDYILKVTKDVTRLEDFEATYATRGHFSATTFSSSNKIKADVTSGYIRPTSVFLSLEQLAELRGIIEQAKQKLDSSK
jgi:hypothetical protein